MLQIVDEDPFASIANESIAILFLFKLVFFLNSFNSFLSVHVLPHFTTKIIAWFAVYHKSCIHFLANLIKKQLIIIIVDRNS